MRHRRLWAFFPNAITPAVAEINQINKQKKPIVADEIAQRVKESAIKPDIMSSIPLSQREWTPATVLCPPHMCRGMHSPPHK